MKKNLNLTYFLFLSSVLFAQEHTSENSFEIIWNTAAFESSNVYRSLSEEELNTVEAFRLDDKVNIIYLNEIMSVKIYPKNQLIKINKD